MRKRLGQLLGLIIGVLFIGNGTVQGQAVITGSVYSEKAPLVGANVGIQGTTKGAAADSDGRFQITGLEAGTYQVAASAIGYKSQQQEVVVAAGDTAVVNFTLQEQVLKGEEVVVTGTMVETYVKDSPVKVEVVNTEYLQKQTTSNLMDVIGSVNGLSQQLNCGVCYTNNIRINGVEGANTAVLIDGMPIMGALASVYGLNSLNPSLIKQVEIIKGPSSTLYGTQALGGVINVITKQPERTPSFQANSYLKSTGEGNLDLSVSPDIGPLKTMLGTNVTYMNNYIDGNGDGFSDLSRLKRVSVFGKGSIPGSNQGRMLDLFARYYHENRNAGVKGFRQKMRGSESIYGESVFTRRFELLGAMRPSVFEGHLKLNGAYNYHYQDSFYGNEAYKAQQEVAYGQFTWNQEIASQSDLLLGGTVRHETYNDNTPATGDFTASGDTLLEDRPDRTFIPGIFAQNETVLSDDLRLLGGLRFDYHGEHGLITAPRFSAKYSPSASTTFRLNTGTGFRVVNIFTEDHAALSGSRNVVITEDLQPEESYSLTTSGSQILPLGTSPMTVELEAFYTRFTNKIIPDYDTDPNLIVYSNLKGHSVSRGLAINVSQNFTALPLSYNAGFTLLDVYTRENGVRTGVTYAPDFEGNFTATYEVPALHTTLDYTALLTGSKRMPESYAAFGRDLQSPVFTVHNLQMTTELIHLGADQNFGIDLYFSAENLFDFTQGSPLVNAANPFSETFDTVYTYGPIFGRTFSGGLRMHIR